MQKGYSPCLNVCCNSPSNGGCSSCSLSLALAGFGVYSLQRLPIDAVPDITNNQVQINTVFAGFSPVEIEQQITFPIETALAGFRAWSRPAPCPAMVFHR